MAQVVPCTGQLREKESSLPYSPESCDRNGAFYGIFSLRGNLMCPVGCFVIGQLPLCATRAKQVKEENNISTPRS